MQALNMIELGSPPSNFPPHPHHHHHHHHPHHPPPHPILPVSFIQSVNKLFLRINIRCLLQIVLLIDLFYLVQLHGTGTSKNTKISDCLLSLRQVSKDSSKLGLWDNFILGLTSVKNFFTIFWIFGGGREDNEEVCGDCHNCFPYFREHPYVKADYERYVQHLFLIVLWISYQTLVQSYYRADFNVVFGRYAVPWILFRMILLLYPFCLYGTVLNAYHYRISDEERVIIGGCMKAGGCSLKCCSLSGIKNVGFHFGMTIIMITYYWFETT